MDPHYVVVLLVYNTIILFTFIRVFAAISATTNSLFGEYTKWLHMCSLHMIESTGRVDKTNEQSTYYSFNVYWILQSGYMG